MRYIQFLIDPTTLDIVQSSIATKTKNIATNTAQGTNIHRSTVIKIPFTRLVDFSLPILSSHSMTLKIFLFLYFVYTF